MIINGPYHMSMGSFNSGMAFRTLLSGVNKPGVFLGLLQYLINHSASRGSFAVILKISVIDVKWRTYTYPPA